MTESASPWNLFGYDIRFVARWFQSGVRQLLWEPVGGVRERIDQPVLLWDGDSRETRLLSDFGNEAGEQKHAAVALRLPESLVLARRISLPVAIEDELEETIELEVQANSPFPEEDRCYGWRVVERDETTLTVAVAIALGSEVDKLLRDSLPAELAAEREAEVWYVDESGLPVVFQGFGEPRRRVAYERRLYRWLGWGGAALAALSLLVLMPALASSLRAEKMQAMFDRVQQEVAGELRLREELAGANALLEEINAELTLRPDYRGVLEALARTTPDSTYVNLLNLEANEISISGFGEDASVFMQTLSGQPWLSAVTAPRAFQRDPRSGRERFTIDAVIPLQSGESIASAAVERAVGERNERDESGEVVEVSSEG